MALTLRTNPALAGFSFGNDSSSVQRRYVKEEIYQCYVRAANAATWKIIQLPSVLNAMGL